MLKLSPKQNVHHYNMRTFTPFIIKGNGEGFFIHKNQEIPMKKFLKMYPVPDRVVARHCGQFKGEGIGNGKI